MAAVFALSLVPAGAWAEGQNDQNPYKDHGELYTDVPYDAGETGTAGQGSITIKNAKVGETYDIYRIFDLASFNDQDRRAGKHDDSTEYATGEAYSYVIREHEDAADSTTANKWWTFLTTYNKDGAKAATGAAAQPYMVSSKVYDELSEGEQAYVYFTYEPEAVTLTDHDGTQKSDFHAVKATDAFSNVWDVTKTEDEETALPNTFEYDGQDYVDTTNGGTNAARPSIQAVQDFAQDALAYAKKNNIAVDYTETAESATVNVNNEQNAVPAQGKVYLGWYLMGTATGTLASLDTTNKDVVLYDKNEVPGLKKQVLKKGATTANALTAAHLADDDLEAYKVKTRSDVVTYNDWATDTTTENKGALDWVDNTDADVNDLVQFRTVVDAKQGASRYVLHDVMEPGLKLLHQTYNASSPYGLDATAATNNSEDIATANVDRYNSVADYDLKVYLVRDGSATEIPSVTSIGSSNYRNWVAKWDQDDGCDFEIEFLDATTDFYGADFGDKDNKVAFVVDNSGKTDIDVKDGDKIVVTYWAKVLPTATVWGQEDGPASGDYSSLNYNDPDMDDSEPAEQSPWADAQQVHEGSDGNSRNTNSTVLTYGAKSRTEWDKADVTTYQLDIVKTQNGETACNLLNGAKFRMYKAAQFDMTTGAQVPTPAGGVAFVPASGKNTLDGIAVGQTGYYATSKALLFEQVDGFTTTGKNVADPAPKTLKSYRYKGDVATADATNTQTLTDFTESRAANVLVSEYGQELSVHGLEEGWYLLVEEEAPEGFNKLAHPIAVYVSGDMDDSHNLDYNGVDESTDEGKLRVASKDNDSNQSDASAYTAWDATVTAPSGTASATNPATYATTSNGGVRVINNTGAELPSTGGVGTTIFYVAGTVLVVGAVVMLVAKRRMGAEA